MYQNCTWTLWAVPSGNMFFEVWAPALHFKVGCMCWRLDLEGPILRIGASPMHTQRVQVPYSMYMGPRVPLGEGVSYIPVFGLGRARFSCLKQVLSGKTCHRLDFSHACALITCHLKEKAFGCAHRAPALNARVPLAASLACDSFPCASLLRWLG